MTLGLNTLAAIGSNSYIQVDDEKILIYGKDKDSSRSAQKNTAPSNINKDLQKKEQEKEQDPLQLSEGEAEFVKRLQERDAEVKRHENAHQSAGAGITGVATYTYQQGPDGKMYAVGGSVPLSTSTASTPQESLSSAKKIASAALAAESPSTQDYNMVSSAQIMQMKAQQQLTNEQYNKQAGLAIYAQNQNALAS